MRSVPGGVATGLQLIAGIEIAIVNPVAIASRNSAHAKAVAEQFTIPRCHETVAELLADQDIEVLDIAVPPDVQPSILRAANNSWVRITPNASPCSDPMRFWPPSPRVSDR